jgi:chromosome segregation ATPase
MWAEILGWIKDRFKRAIDTPPPAAAVADFKAIADLAAEQARLAVVRYDALAQRLDDHVQAGEARHAALSADYGALSADMGRMHRELRECQRKHAEAETEVRVLKGIAKGLKAQNKAQQAEIDKLKSAISGAGLDGGT